MIQLSIPHRIELKDSTDHSSQVWKAGNAPALSLEQFAKECTEAAQVSTACGSGRVLATLATRPLPQAVLT